MMKRRLIHKKFLRISMICVLLCLLSGQALAYDAQMAQAWLEQFAHALAGMQPINDPAQTADPARAGRYVLEYAFGTVTSSVPTAPDADQILAIDVRTQQVTDCRGLRVGMSLNDVLGGAHVGASSTQLYVLDAQESGWSWAYVDNGGIYGVEHIAYGGSGALTKEYTLTYVIGDGQVSAIRMQFAEATDAQAQEGVRTAREIAGRQHGELLAMANDETAFSQMDLQVMGVSVLGREVADLVAVLGEPQEIQNLPDGSGRILLYDGAAVTLSFDVATGMEVVRGISVSVPMIEGPRRLSVGFSAQEATALFYCEADVTSLGGALYVAGEARGEAPYGELKASGAGDVTLTYACRTDSGEVAMLEAGIQGGVVAYWHLFYQRDWEGGV